jgi:hypothetical protein
MDGVGGNSQLHRAIIHPIPFRARALTVWIAAIVEGDDMVVELDDRWLFESAQTAELPIAAPSSINATASVQKIPGSEEQQFASSPPIISRGSHKPNITDPIVHPANIVSACAGSFSRQPRRESKYTAEVGLFRAGFCDLYPIENAKPKSPKIGFRFLVASVERTPIEGLLKTVTPASFVARSSLS